jgi:hypothetical protein
VTIQVGVELVGSDETATSPASSTATQSDVDGQETPPNVWPSVKPLDQAVGPPVGFDDVVRAVSKNAAQSEVDGHETPFRPKIEKIFV